MRRKINVVQAVCRFFQMEEEEQVRLQSRHLRTPVENGKKGNFMGEGEKNARLYYLHLRPALP